MKFYLNFLSFLLILLGSTVLSAQKTPNRISGYVTSSGSPLSNVNITVLGSSQGVKSDVDGKYVVRAFPRDTVLFSFVGMKKEYFIVEDITKILNLEMKPFVNELDEVTVTEKRERNNKQLELEWHSNKELIKSSFGFLDKRRASGTMWIVDGEDLLPAGQDFIASLEYHVNFFGRVDRSDSSHLGPKVFLRKGIIHSGGAKGPPFAIYDVDGQIMTSAPTYLAIDDIDRIALIPGVGASALYGMRGVGGVIVINTKSGNRKFHSNLVSGRPYADNSNIYDSSALNSKDQGSNPKYLLELNSATSQIEAFEIYKKYSKLLGSSPYFLLDVSTHFREKWKNEDRANELLEKVSLDFEDNPEVLKAVAYLYEQENKLEEALEVYKTIFKLRPRYAQSYRDLANLYGEVGENQKALQLYGRYINVFAIDTLTPPLQGIDSIISTEVSNIYLSQRAKSANSVQSAVYWPVRIVVEWSHSEAEFELQFVNPDDRYFTWDHTRNEKLERINHEKIKGYSSEQFLIDDSFQGEWKLNLTYLGNKEYDPTYFKITTYRNFGKPSQTREVKVIKASEKNRNRNVLNLGVY